MSSWKSGPPPSIGWWPTCMPGVYCLNPDDVPLRWWNGKVWSLEVYPDASPIQAGRVAMLSSETPIKDIRWRERPRDWPAASKT